MTVLSGITVLLLAASFRSLLSAARLGTASAGLTLFANSSDADDIPLVCEPGCHVDDTRHYVGKAVDWDASGTSKKPTILLTGYGPFNGTDPNPSEVIVRRLSMLPDVHRAANMHVEVVPVVYSDALRVAIKAKRQLKVDFAIHVGLDANTPVVKLEQQSFQHGLDNEGYNIPDIKDKLPCCHLASNQTRISSVLDFTQLANEVIDSGHVSSHFIMTSYDPGNYLCGYIYYQSLLLEGGRALFVHVPNFTERLTAEDLTEALHEIV